MELICDSIRMTRSCSARVLDQRAVAIGPKDVRLVSPRLHTCSCSARNRNWSQGFASAESLASHVFLFITFSTMDVGSPDLFTIMLKFIFSIGWVLFQRATGWYA